MGNTKEKVRLSSSQTKIPVNKLNIHMNAEKGGGLISSVSSGLSKMTVSPETYKKRSLFSGEL